MNDDLVRAYDDHLKSRGQAPQTRVSARNAVRNLLRWLMSKGLTLADLTPATANDYLYSYVLRGRQKQPLDDQLCRLRHFCRFAVARGLLPADPTVGIVIEWLCYPGGYPAYHGPLRQIFKCPSASFAYLLPRWTPYWELYLRHLLDQKYDTATLGQIAFVNHDFYQWLLAKKRTWQHMTPDLLQGYMCHVNRIFPVAHKRRKPSQSARDHRNYIEGFLAFAFKQTGRIFRKPKPRPNSRLMPNALLDQYIAFCRDHRGLATTTCAGRYSDLVRFRDFLHHQQGIKHLRHVTITTMDDYFRALSRRMSLRALAHVISTMRSFFRFLFLHGKYRRNLADDIVPPHRFSADTRPKYLPWSKLQPFLDGLDRSALVSKRNFAIVILLAHHGLRPSEVAKLKLSDIDWKQSSMMLNHRKNGVSAQFPMTAPALAALRDYLTVRPVCRYPEIFLTSEAPIEPLSSRAICHMVWRLLKGHFGNSVPCYGPYVLRHSFAKALLDQGATLPEVGVMLGHKQLNSTLIYSRINTHDLSEVADTYARLLP